MKKILFSFIAYFSFLDSFAADPDAGILWEWGLDVNQIRKGEIHAEDIPWIIQGAINFFMGIAGTVALVFIIIGAYQILFWAISDNKQKGKDTIIMALSWFALAALSWFIIRLILDNFS